MMITITIRMIIMMTLAIVMVLSVNIIAPENINTAVEDDISAWTSRLTHKLQCLHQKVGSIYFYHMRKAAGTTITQILNVASWRLVFRKIFTTEGKTLDPTLLDQSGLTMVTSFRHPIDRIRSLYWYEHASFHYFKNASKMVTMETWFDEWCDGSEWKTKFITENPGNVYVEVDNYYTKVLSNWTGPGPITLNNFEIAKENLKKFDIILIQEWMKSITQWNAIVSTFPASKSLEGVYKVRGDPSIRKNLFSRYAANETAIIEKMIKINNFDLMLYDYALKLAAMRLKLMPSIVEASKNKLTNKACIVNVDKSQVDLHRPNGHKGPFPKR